MIPIILSLAPRPYAPRSRPPIFFEFKYDDRHARLRQRRPLLLPAPGCRERNIMKAFIIDRYSKQAPMRLGELPEPELRDDDVLIDVHAAGINLLDSKIKSGEFKLILPYRLPLVLGHDVAGVVTRVGSRVRQFKAGDPVYSRPADLRIGTFAQLIAVNQNDV